MIKNVETIFASSKILTAEMMTNDLLLVMPQKMRKAELLYQHSTELVAI